MDMQEKISLVQRQIATAIDDYGAHVSDTAVLEDVSDTFIRRLANDSVHAKEELREMFRKSPVWDETLDALVINGTRTHNPDFDLIYNLGSEILTPAMYQNNERDTLIRMAILLFSDQNAEEDEYRKYIDAIKILAPKAYTPTKKLSRVFKALCDALGVSDDTAGSKFQRLYAQFADELSSKKIGFKLFVSLNPAHFVTMSNPKNDERGDTMTSCHSFNSTQYNYNNGCSGYARDNCTMIAFTASDPSNPETLNNRKTTRQLFMYRPGGGLLLQSRMYNTSGGTRGAQAESKVYRDLIQREISACENAANLWKTYKYYENKQDIYFPTGDGFGGYADWPHEEFAANISIRSDHESDYKAFSIGTWGLCIACGDEIDEGLYCEDCSGDYCCQNCGERCSETYTVHGRNGEEIEVCESCRDDDFYWCVHCEEYYHRDDVTHIGDDWVCESCRDEDYTKCECCGEYDRTEDMYNAVNSDGDTVKICEGCCNREYYECYECGEYVKTTDSYEAHKNGEEIIICPACRNSFYEECEDCGELWHEDELENGLCPKCLEEREADAV